MCQLGRLVPRRSTTKDAQVCPVSPHVGRPTVSLGLSELQQRRHQGTNQIIVVDRDVRRGARGFDA
jgi:hypothetical protein